MPGRVLQRTAEHALLRHVAMHAAARGFRRLVGSWVPSGRNVPARDVYGDAGFHLESGGGEDEAARWVLELAQGTQVKDPGFVQLSVEKQESARG